MLSADAAARSSVLHQTDEIVRPVRPFLPPYRDGPQRNAVSLRGGRLLYDFVSYPPPFIAFSPTTRSLAFGRAAPTHSGTLSLLPGAGDRHSRCVLCKFTPFRRTKKRVIPAPSPPKRRPPKESSRIQHVFQASLRPPYSCHYLIRSSDDDDNDETKQSVVLCFLCAVTCLGSYHRIRVCLMCTPAVPCL